MQSAPTSNIRVVSSLFWRITLFALPFLIIIGGFTGLAYYTGEIMPLEEIHRLQEANTHVVYSPVGLGTTEQFFYKKMAIERRHPKFLVLGSSRMMPFRAEMFALNPTVFYNASLGQSRTEDHWLLLRNLPEDALPDVILLGVDINFLRASSDKGKIKDLPATYPMDFVLSLRGMTQQILRGELPLDKLLVRTDPRYGNPALGTQAIMEGRGFRWDGSRQFYPLGDQALVEMESNELDDTWQPTPGSEVHEGHMRALESMLSWAQERGIIVIGVLPSFRISFYETVANQPGYDYIATARARVSALFTQYGFSSFDFSDPRLLGVGDEEMRDGHHPTERLEARMLLVMTQTVPVLSEYVDAADLERRIADSVSPYELFDAFVSR